MLRYILTSICLLLFALGGLDAVCATTLYVDNMRGDDRFDGLSERNAGGAQGPVRTIDRALRIASHGDRVVIANTGEPYRESISLYGNRNSGHPELPFLIEGNGAILDGAAPIDHRAWRHVRGNLFRFRPTAISYQQLYSDGVPLEKIDVDPARPLIPQLKPGQWCVLGDHIYLLVDDGRLPIDYALSHTARQTGVTIYSVRNVIVTDLVVQGFRLDGVNVHDLSRDVLLSGITARGNARSGVSVGGSSHARLAGSVIGDNGAAQVRTEEYGLLEVIETELIDNTAPKWRVDGGRLIIDDKPVSPAPSP
ncbi:MAG: right-handed parallel beta-helix repeat-containing protein [Pirellulales bacterium]